MGDDLHPTTDTYEFGPGELRVVGGDYGQITLEGTSEATRNVVRALAAGAGRGDRCVVDIVSVRHIYRETPVIPPRHAGLEGTSHFDTSGSSDRTSSEEGRAEVGAGEGPADGAP